MAKFAFQIKDRAWAVHGSRARGSVVDDIPAQSPRSVAVKSSSVCIMEASTSVKSVTSRHTGTTLLPRYPKMPSMRLIDLNSDCLEMIFMHLSMNQLFTVAMCDANLAVACRRVFYRKFRHKEIIVTAHQLEYTQFPHILSIFGDIIRYVRVTYDTFDVNWMANDQIHRSIGQFCCDTLTELTFNNILPTMDIETTFGNVQKLSFNQGCIGQLHIRKSFPKLRCLQFFFSEVIWPKCIEDELPTLDKLTVAHNSFSVDNLKGFLRRNPQLKQFCVYNYNRQVISDLKDYTRENFASLAIKFEVYPCYFAFKNS